jgi:hypothetical protein
MLSRQTINRGIIIGFMMLVGFCMAKAIHSGSIIGIILACISLFAGVYFLYLLANAKQEMQEAEARKG